MCPYTLPALNTPYANRLARRPAEITDLIRNKAKGVCLAAQTKLSDDRAVALDVVCLEVIKEPATTTHQHQETTTRMMVLLVLLKMLGQMIDPVGEKRNLNFSGPSIGGRLAELCDRVGLRWKVGGLTITHNVSFLGYLPSSSDR